IYFTSYNTVLIQRKVYAFYCAIRKNIIYNFNYFLFCVFTKTEVTIYNSIITGMASNRINSNNNADMPKNSKPTLLSFKVLFFVFKENNRILAFIMKALNKLIPNNT